MFFIDTHFSLHLHNFLIMFVLESQYFLLVCLWTYVPQVKTRVENNSYDLTIFFFLNINIFFYVLIFIKLTKT